MNISSVIESSWRPQGDYFWQDYDAVIATEVRGRRRSFDVYLHGRQIASRSSLLEAQAAVPGAIWRMVSLPLVEVEHYYFGPTDEFTDPVTIWVADLAKTAGADTVTLYHGTRKAFLPSIRSQGLEPGKDSPNSLNHEPFVHFAYSRKDAANWGDVVLVVKVPKEWVEPHPVWPDTSCIVRRRVPPEMIAFGKTAASVDDIRQALDGIAFSDRAVDGDCFPVSGEVHKRLRERGYPARIAYVTGWVDRAQNIVAFVHLAVVVEGVVIDGSATQFDLRLPALIVLPVAEYEQLLSSTLRIEVSVDPPRRESAKLAGGYYFCPRCRTRWYTESGKEHAQLPDDPDPDKLLCDECETRARYYNMAPVVEGETVWLRRVG